MNLSDAQLGALRALGITIILAVVTFAANSVNIAPLVGTGASVILAMVAGALEQYLAPTKGSLFGLVK